MKIFNISMRDYGGQFQIQKSGDDMQSVAVQAEKDYSPAWCVSIGEVVEDKSEDFAKAK